MDLKEEEGPIKVAKKEATESPLLEDQKKPSESPKTEQIVVTKQSFWERFLLKLSVEEKAIITENIVLEIETTPLYWVELIISVVIATFGLLQNSVAIIIGAMLLAPLLRPIKGLAFAITTGQPRYFGKALWMLFFSIVMAVFSAYLVSLIIPLKIETSEIIARTAPNLLDLLIAVAAGVVAILSLYFKKLSENIAGVAMAAAIMPPLAVTGIELALANTGAMWGSFFLFLTNLFAILTVGVVIFLMYGFLPSQKDFKQRVGRVIAILFILLAFIAFPLVSSLTHISDEIALQSQATAIFESSIKMSYPGIALDELNIVEFNDKLVKISGVLKVPLDVDFGLEDQQKVRSYLVDEFERRVDLELELIPVITTRF